MASNDCPRALKSQLKANNQFKKKKKKDQRKCQFYREIKYPFENLQNAFAMATFPMIEINGTITIPEPRFLQISTKVSVRFPTVIEKDGGAMVGRPASMWPVRRKGTSP